MEHEIRALKGISVGGIEGVARAVEVGAHGKIGEIDSCPGDVLRHAGYSINDDFTRGYKHDMDHPST
jgi:hypothetical protein